MQKKRIVAFGDSISYPSKDGISAHTIGVLWTLSLSRRFDVTLIVCQRGNEHLPQFIRDHITIIELTPNDYYDVNAMSRLLESVSPDVVQTYSSYYARLVVFPYTSLNKIPTIVEHHDIDVEHLNNYNVAGTHQWQVEAVERASLNRTLSSSDADKLRAMAIHCSEKIVNIPTIILPESSDTAIQDRANGGSDVLFIGNCSYPPNLQAAEYIINQLAPVFPQKTFHIVGRNSDKLQTSLSNVRLYGFVENISEIATRCQIGIAPLSSGSGLKIKVLTYLSLGLIVVGTKKAFAGFEPSSYLIPTSLSAFGDSMNGIFNRQNNLSKCAVMDYFNSTYHNDEDADRLCTLYENLEYDEYLTDTNSTEVALDARFIPFLNESR